MIENKKNDYWLHDHQTNLQKIVIQNKCDRIILNPTESIQLQYILLWKLIKRWIDKYFFAWKIDKYEFFHTRVVDIDVNIK